MKSEIPANAAPRDIRERVFAYALRAIRLYQALQRGQDSTGWILGKQYLRSATSIGASLAEARSGESRADFIHKYGVAQKEARESLYWLELLAESEIVRRAQLEPLIKETNGLLSVITTIIVHSKSGKPAVDRSSSR